MPEENLTGQVEVANPTKPFPLVWLFVVILLFLSLGLNTFQYLRKSPEASEPVQESLTIPTRAITPKQNQELIDQFVKQTLVQHSDLQIILEQQEIENAKRVIRDQAKPPNAWLIDTIDKDNSEADSLPRHLYLVTQEYWQDFQGPLSIECGSGGIHFVVRPNTELSSDEIVSLVVSWSCGPVLYASLVDYQTGEKIALSDPQNLIRADYNQRIITVSGDTAGSVVPVLFGINPIFMVDYGDAEPYGRAIFSAETGELMDLIVYRDYTE